MTGPNGKSEFCFPKSLNDPQGKAKVNMEVEGKQNPLFPRGPVTMYFVTPPNSKRHVGKNCVKIVCLILTGPQICHGFKEHGQIMCELKVEVVASLES